MRFLGGERTTHRLTDTIYDLHALNPTRRVGRVARVDRETIEPDVRKVAAIFLKFLRTVMTLFRPREGASVSPPLIALLYVTSGFAALRMDFRQTFSEPPFTTPPDGTPQVATFSKTKAGWTIGAGVEAGLWGNWTVKAEYL